MSIINKNYPTVPTDKPETVEDPNVDTIRDMFDKGKSTTEILDDWLAFKIDHISTKREEAKRKYDAPDRPIFPWDDKDESAYDVPISCYKAAKYMLNLINTVHQQISFNAKKETPDADEH
jgi:hypothetical protein